MAKQSKHVRPYAPEFRAEAIRLARTSGKPHAQIAQDLGMTSAAAPGEPDFARGARDPEKSRRLLRSGDRLDPVRVYEFVEREKVRYAVVRMCRVLGVSPSGYWAWRRREPSARAHANAQLTEQTVQIHQASRGTYGALRVHAELEARGIPCGHNRVARLMRRAGLVGCHRRRPAHTTQRDPLATPAPDLVQRSFLAPAPDQLWIADITYGSCPDLVGQLQS